ncbi:MAG: phosphotransferase family protein [Deltaproteobacteria bacterium]|nr:phosphotransferase family protein [Deltaproteobacteria bacterium]
MALALPPILPTLTPEWEKAFGWIEREIGGRVVRAQRQARWRPAWFLDLERDGETLPLYFRGQRAEDPNGFEALDREARVLRKLEAEGIPVPHVYGLCPDPGGVVLARSPGRANLATADSEAQRTAVLEDYMDVLARIHALDASGFEALGLTTCEGDEQLGLGDFDSWVARFRAAKSRPEPAIEFLIGWIRRNVPRGRKRQSFVCADAGQFLFEANRVTAVIDLELAYVGDPAADLGSLRSRDLSEPLGDLSHGIRHYEERTGEPVDRRVIDFHTVRFAACTPLAVAPMVASALPGLDFVQYLGWYLVYARTPLEVIAAGSGVALDPVDLPEPVPTRHSPGGDALAQMLSTKADGEAEYETYRREMMLRAAEYLRRAESLGPEFEARNLDDLEALLGSRPGSGLEGDAALEAHVLGAGPEQEAELASCAARACNGWTERIVSSGRRGLRR